MQMRQARTKVLQVDSPGRDLHIFVFGFVYVFDIIGLYFCILLRGSRTHTPNIEVQGSKKF